MKHAVIPTVVFALLATVALSSCNKDAAADTKIDKTKIAVTIKNDVHDMIEAMNAKDVDEGHRPRCHKLCGHVPRSAKYGGTRTRPKATTKLVVADPLFWVRVGQ